MNSQIEKLIDLIREEEAVLQEFLETLNRQKEHIVQNNAELFDQSVLEEEGLIEKIRSLEEGRIDVVRSIATTSGDKATDLSLTRLIEMNLGEVSSELKTLKRTLAALVDRIKRANRINQYLIKRSLSFIQTNIDWFIDDNNLNMIYAPNGEQQRKGMGNILIDKVL
mgnify:CR=1 FL=1